MTWHLKDRELEKKLNELVGGKQFTEALNRECSCINSQKIIVVKFGENTGHVKGSFRCYFEKDELTNIGYDPHNWNNYPEVTPPKDVTMLLSFDDGYCTKAYFDGEEWIETYQVRPLLSHRKEQLFRYRPWED